MISLGKEAVLSLSLKQKQKVKISTEGGLEESHDGISVVLGSKYFIESQEYTVEHKKFYQDNKSTILMKKNDISSSSNKKNT